MIMTRRLISAGLLIVASQADGVMAQNAAPKPVSRATFLAALGNQFTAVDANHDNVATVAEIEAYQRAQGTALIQRQTAATFTQLDSNRDGVLSRAEFARIASSASIRPDPSPMLAKADANKDGKISLVEFRAAANANFNKLDVNRDNIIGLDEMRVGQPKR